MFIIVEGPDGAGKTTFIQLLSKRLHARGRGCVLVNPKASPCRPAVEEYAHDLAWYFPGKNHDLILDRSWRSEEIYGPPWRGKALPPGDLDLLEAWAKEKAGVFVRLDAPDTTLVHRIGGRGDDLISGPKELRAIAQAYRELPLRWDFEYFSSHYPTQSYAELIIDAAQQAETNLKRRPQ